MKLFMYMYETDKFEWYSHERGNVWKKNVVLDAFPLKTV